jgi:subtilisin-like proprotein convertase family protein
MCKLYNLVTVMVVMALAPNVAIAEVFTGTDPNGTWKLYVVDDAGIDSGRLLRWALRIRTATT